LPKPDEIRGEIPAFLREDEAAHEIDENKSAIKKQIKKVRTVLEQAIFEPSQHDPIYQCLQKLFAADCSYHLTRTKHVRSHVLSLAHERFALGYPPRKAGDRSCGDAVNWEWIICCANDSKRDIIVVSRDHDYGYTINKKPVLNNWLSCEFANRVGNAQEIALMDHMTAAFKEAKIQVSAEQEKEEKDIIEERTKAIERGAAPFASDLTIAHPSLSFTGANDQFALLDWTAPPVRFITEGDWEKQREQGDTDEQ
jgi:hypothetical protein